MEMEPKKANEIGAEKKSETPKQKKFLRLVWEHKAATTIFVIVILLISLIICMASIWVVPAGYKGVITSAPDQNQIGTVLDEGWHLNPYYLMCHIENIRYNTQSVEFSVTVSDPDVMSNLGPVNVRSKDNLELDVDFSITFHLPADMVSHIRVTYGDYQHSILQQVARSIPRDVASFYNGLDLAGPMRSEFEGQVTDNITSTLEEYDIIVEMVNIRAINLPDDVDQAVQEKKIAEQQLIAANYTAQKYIVLAQGQANAAVINATGFAQATIIKANGSAQAIDLIMGIIRTYDTNATIDAYLTQQFITALNDPNSNIQYVILYDGNGVPVIIDLTP